MVLVDPQLGENIGMVARAMLNCALGDLRLVRPRDGWPNAAAVKAASGAHGILDRARLYGTVEEAIAELRHVYAATARPRYMVKPVVTPNAAAVEMRTRTAAGEACGVLFGPESRGLTNDEVALADALVTVPLNPDFTSLNLAQAVLIIGYEWFQAPGPAPARTLPLGTSRPATRAELVGLFAHLEGALDDSGFLRLAAKRASMVRNLRNLFERAGLTRQEVRTLRGIIASLVNPRPRG